MDVYVLKPPAGLDLVGLCTETGPDCAFAMAAGWHDPEANGSDWWRWSDGGGRLRVFAEREMDVWMDGALGSIQPPDRVDILVNGGTVRSLDIASADLQRLGPIVLRLKAGENLVEFRGRNPAIRVSDDPRLRTLVVHNLSMTGGGNAPACTLLP